MNTKYKSIVRASFFDLKKTHSALLGRCTGFQDFGCPALPDDETLFGFVTLDEFIGDVERGLEIDDAAFVALEKQIDLAFFCDISCDF